MNIDMLIRSFLCGIVVAALPALASAADVPLPDAAQKGDRAAVQTLLKTGTDVNTRQADGTTALAWAAHRDDQQTADLLIAAGANANATNDFGVSPLALACLNGSATMVEKLLNAGANAKSALPTGETVLMRCSRTGNVAAVKSLLARGADVNAKENRYGQTALMWAVEQKHIDIAKALIDSRADIHARSKGGFTPLLFAVQQGNSDLVRMLVDAGANVNEATAGPSFAGGPPAGTPPLLMAAASGHEEIALYLLEKGANPLAADDNGASALHYALLKGMIMLVRDRQSVKVGDLVRQPNLVQLTKALLTRGASPNARLTRNIARLRVGLAEGTPFMLATLACDVDMMRLLLSHGANPMLATAKNTTTLMLAAGVGQSVDRTPDEQAECLEAVKLLLSLGADVNAVGEHNWTSLHGTAYTGSDAIAQLLVEKGAKLDPRDEWEQTPLSIAQGQVSVLIDDFGFKTQGPHPSTAALLQKLGAPPWIPPVRSDAARPKPANESADQPE